MINVTKGLVKGIEAQGHQVELIDGLKSMDKKLTVYQYIVIGAEAISIFGKISEKLTLFLSQAGQIMGKKSSAFILHSPLGSTKAIETLMKAMEKEGMFLKFSDIIRTQDEAEEIGKNLHISK
ncbi:MAG: hypothetical protein JXR70_03375 [Spirochaetales bacterium]|nr:hypothetical protein [Spirochaetales bacterium]